MEWPEGTAGLVAAAQKGGQDAAGDLIRAFYPRVLKIEVAAAPGLSEVTARKIYSRALQRLGRLARSAG